jgi:hypothetical protein
VGGMGMLSLVVELDGLSMEPVTRQSFFDFKKTVFHLRAICG